MLRAYSRQARVAPFAPGDVEATTEDRHRPGASPCGGASPRGAPSTGDTPPSGTRPGDEDDRAARPRLALPNDDEVAFYARRKSALGEERRAEQARAYAEAHRSPFVAMGDWAGVPRTSAAQRKPFFPGGSASANVKFDQFTIPRRASFVMIQCLGSGSSGGGGFTRAAGANGGGGGGGASGGLNVKLFDASSLPTVLYLALSFGGLSSPAGTIGNPGAQSFVCSTPNATTFANSQNIIMTSGSSPATGGAAGTAAGSRAGGAGEQATFANGAAWGGLSPNTLSLAGQSGSASGALGAAGVTLTWSTTGIPFSGGAGGASVSTTNANSAGGGITGTDYVPSIPAGAAGGGRGGDGTHSWVHGFWGIGGTGGGSNGAAGVGGRGGDAGMGCGGGGGGSGVTGGASGNGGFGIVIISWW